MAVDFSATDHPKGQSALLHRELRLQRGFTLIELVIAMLLMSIVVSAAAYGISLALKAYEHSQGAEVSKQQAQLALWSMLRSQLYSAYPYQNPSLNGEPYTYFQGSEGELRFVTLAPARIVSSETGMIMSWYRVGGKAVGRGKVVGGVSYGERIVTHQDLEHLRGGRREEGLRVAESLGELVFSYYDKKTKKWLKVWSGKRRQGLPAAVRVSVETPAGEQYQKVFELPVSREAN